MSRPKPVIIDSRYDQKGIFVMDLLASDAIWTVFCDGQPFNLRRRNSLLTYPGPKYFRQAFASPGHAFSLKRKLAKQFKHRRFDVVALTLAGGTVVKGNYPGEDRDYFGDPDD